MTEHVDHWSEITDAVHLHSQRRPISPNMTPGIILGSSWSFRFSSTMLTFKWPIARKYKHSESCPWVIIKSSG